MQHHEYMSRVIQLAQSGKGLVEPNPLVGCVIVRNTEIIAEGFHAAYGGAHAEVNAINRVNDKSLLKESTLYVNLEPCSHHGKTPPCVDLILKHKIPKVIIANQDPNHLVNGSGIDVLKNSGVEVIVGILEQEGRFLNRRFFTFQEKKRPYIILKWAESKDGFIDKIRSEKNTSPTSISSSASKQLSHQWRTEEQAILIGKNTALLDDPLLTARLFSGRQPVRVIIDKENTLPKNLAVFNSDTKTICYNQVTTETNGNYYFKKIEFNDTLNEILSDLYNEQILSIIVEGGAYTLQQFIDAELWDEARVFSSDAILKEGISSPILTREANSSKKIDQDLLRIYYSGL